MNSLGTRQAIEEFARLLDGAGPASTHAPATAGKGVGAGQLALVERLRAVTPMLDRGAIPTPVFRTALRTRLVAVAAVQPPAPTPSPVRATAQWSQGRGVQRRLGATAAALAGVIALTGVGVAGSRSLPGAPLYGLKRGVEDVQLALAGDDIAEGTRQLQFAQTRLREVVTLTDGARQVSVGPVASAGLVAAGPLALGGRLDARLRATLTDMDRETRSGYRLLAKAYRRTSRTELLRQLATFSTAQRGELTAVLPALPAGAHQQAAASLALVTVIGDNARALLEGRACPTDCTPAPTGSGRPGGQATIGPFATNLPAPGRATPATRAPATHAPATHAPATRAPATGAPLPIRPPAGHPPRTPGDPHPAAPDDHPGPPARLPQLPPPVLLPPAPLPPRPIPSMLHLPVPVRPGPVLPVPPRQPTKPPLLP